MARSHRGVACMCSSVSLVPGRCARLLQLACAVHASDMREHLTCAHAVVIGGLFNDRSLACSAVDRCQTCSIRAIGRHSYVAVVPPSAFFTNAASIVHSTIARPAFGCLPVIVPRLVSNVSLLLKHGRGVEHYLAIDRIASCNALFLMMGTIL